MKIMIFEIYIKKITITKFCGILIFVIIFVQRLFFPYNYTQLHIEFYRTKINQNQNLSVLLQMKYIILHETRENTAECTALKCVYSVLHYQHFSEVKINYSRFSAHLRATETCRPVVLVSAQRCYYLFFFFFVRRFEFIPS